MPDKLVHRFLYQYRRPPNASVDTVPTKMIYSSFPFPHTLQSRTEITRLFNAVYFCLIILFVVRSFSRISASILKDTVKFSSFMRPDDVYLCKCQCCTATLVGQTTHHLHAPLARTRISKQLRISPMRRNCDPVHSYLYYFLPRKYCTLFRHN